MGVDFVPVSYAIGIIVATNIYGFALMGNSLVAPLEKASRLIRYGADISFGLYLFHYPLMYLTRAVLTAMGTTSGGFFILSIYLVPFMASAFLALQCEKHKAVFSRAIGIGFSCLSIRRQAAGQ
jgi:peptidoglycan/LPS O-acetylase OafA/YrhL